MTDAESRDLRRWLASGAQAIKRARERLDAINVFPVADADTGTNMYLTLQEGNRAVSKLPQTASHREVVAAFARGALLGARGNSGVIVSQYLSAFLLAIDTAGGLTDAKPGAIASALQSAADAAYAAVGAPVEGTMLSVAQAASHGATEAAAAKKGRNDVIVAAVVAARSALRATLDDLPAARKAGVVDAGAAGLVLQLEMLAETLAGSRALEGLADVEWELASTGAGVVAVPVHHKRADVGGAYEVMFVARLEDRTPGAAGKPGGRVKASAQGRAGRLDKRVAGLGALPELTAALAALGDSVAVTGTHGLVNAHVHTNRPDDAVAVGIGQNARQILVSSLSIGHAREGSHDHDRAATGVVALTSCPGLAAALADAGAIVLVVPDPARLKRRELRRAVRDATGRGVVIAAGNTRLRAAAVGLANHRSGVGVTVLPAEHEAQVIAAVAAGAIVTPGEPLETVMRAAVEHCDVASSTAASLADDVARLLSADVEVVSLILGVDAPLSVVGVVRRRAAKVCPSADISIYQGGHELPDVLIGVERS